MKEAERSKHTGRTWMLVEGAHGEDRQTQSRAFAYQGLLHTDTLTPFPHQKRTVTRAANNWVVTDEPRHYTPTHAYKTPRATQKREVR